MSLFVALLALILAVISVIIVLSKPGILGSRVSLREMGSASGTGVVGGAFERHFVPVQCPYFLLSYGVSCASCVVASGLTRHYPLISLILSLCSDRHDQCHVIVNIVAGAGEGGWPPWCTV